MRGSKDAKTVDGRRIYKMAVTEIREEGDMLVKKILIKDYLNIWADHKKNDLSYIEVYQNIDKKNELMPELIKIEFKGIVFNLRKT